MKFKGSHEPAAIQWNPMSFMGTAYVFAILASASDLACFLVAVQTSVEVSVERSMGGFAGGCCGLFVWILGVGCWCGLLVWVADVEFLCGLLVVVLR